MPDTPPADNTDLVDEIKRTADKLLADGTGRGEVKLIATALKELRYCFKVFAGYRGTRKVAVFGSARTRPDHPAYLAAQQFGERMSDSGWMTMTGAAAGIMEAGHAGAKRDKSFGLSIILPFESAVNRVIHGDPKLMNLKYFFTRKLAFVKEADAVAVFPGGYGTHDELFEALTLIQTGKSHLFPIVLVDQPGGRYWKKWLAFVTDDLLGEGYISAEDLSLVRVTDSVDEAVDEVTRFYRVYHSMRFVRGQLVLRLNRPLSAATMSRLAEEFADIAAGGRFEQSAMLGAEANEPALKDLPRLRFGFKRHAMGRLRQLIDVLNE